MYWLLKSEPDSWSWDQQVAKGVEGWNGVRNHTAARNLKAMKKGERGFFYHSNTGKAIVGIVEIVREAYPDASDPSGRFVMVDVKAVAPVPRPVTLAEIRTHENLRDMALVRLARLSVQPVTDAEWKLVCGLGQVDQTCLPL